VEHLIDEVTRYSGDVDLLVNNARLIEVGPVENMPQAA
jgi:NAD(P)-dependent dehydrogenase (short-subunit alcohol dehydrogenase family)